MDDPLSMARFQGDKDYFIGLASDGMEDRAGFVANVEAIFAPRENGEISTEIGFSCRPDRLEAAMTEVTRATLSIR